MDQSELGVHNLGRRHRQRAAHLPREIIDAICGLLDNQTIKNLRSTCRFFFQTASLRFDRVFISANPLNVEVFKAVAAHETFRHQIIEIIWDDATLWEGPPLPRDEVEAYYADDSYQYENEEDETRDEDGICWAGNVPRWYRTACKDNIFHFLGAKGSDVDRPDHVKRANQLASHMPMEVSWAYYQSLLIQQRQVLRSEAHIRALEDHISSFPALRRITITPAAHGRLFNPLYETPMIRAFPWGFIHPTPRGWPITTADSGQPDCPEWENDGSDWQGFRTVVRVLAQNRDGGKVTELCVNTSGLETGLNSRLFEQENDTLHDFETVLSRHTFKHLHLDLMVDPSQEQADIFQNGLLKRALTGAAGGQGLDYLHLGTNTELNLGQISSSVDWCVPLRTIFEPHTFSRLRHFGVSRFPVKESDLLSLLAALPQSIQAVDLFLIAFSNKEGSCRSLISNIRDTFGWKDWKPRPKLSIGMDDQSNLQGRSIWLREELDEYLYESGPNPFDYNSAVPSVNLIREGFGRMKDSFEPEYERPHADIWTLKDMGYLKFDESLCPRPQALF